MLYLKTNSHVNILCTFTSVQPGEACSILNTPVWIKNPPGYNKGNYSRWKLHRLTPRAAAMQMSSYRGLPELLLSCQIRFAHIGCNYSLKGLHRSMESKKTLASLPRWMIPFFFTCTEKQTSTIYLPKYQCGQSGCCSFRLCFVQMLAPSQRWRPLSQP